MGSRCSRFDSRSSSRSRGPPLDWSTTRSAAACACVRRASRGSWSAPPVIAISVGVFAATIGAQPALSGQVGQVADRRAPPTTRTPAVLKVLVVGDSQAATLAQGVRADPGVYGLSAQPGLTVWNRAILACPIVSFPVFVIDGNQVENKCGGAGFWQQQWTGDVSTFRPDAVVVMAGAWDVFDAVMPDGSVAHAGNTEFDATYQRDVGDLLDTLSATGAPVVVVKPPCYGESHLVGTDPQIPERRDVARLAAIDTAWTQAARRHGARVLDLDSVLCPGGIADAAVTPDGAHFDGAGADRVAPAVARAVRQAVAAPASPERRVIDDRRRIRNLRAWRWPRLVAAAGCQAETNATQSARPPSTSTTAPLSTTTTPTVSTTTPAAHHRRGSDAPGRRQPVAADRGRTARTPRDPAMGDSLMGETVFTLPAVLAAHGFDAVVYDAHVNGSGLLDPMNGYLGSRLPGPATRGPPRRRHRDLRMGGVCDGCVRTGHPRVWITRVLRGLARRRERPRPRRIRPAGSRCSGRSRHRRHPTSPVKHPSRTGRANRCESFGTTLTMYERRYPADFGVTVADWWQALSDTNGQWQETLWYDDALHTVLVGDRVHLTEDGSTRTSTWTAAALARLYES